MEIPQQLGQIRSAAGYVYDLRPEDLLWLGRAVQFEGGDYASTVWTYAQRMAALRRSSLSSLVRAHSQPVNPMWASPSAEGCQRSPNRCSATALDRRARARSIPWARLRSSVRDTVLAWATARLPNPVPRAVDFADEAVSRAFLRRNPGARVVTQARNWYIATAASRQWPADFVTMHAEGRVAGPASARSPLRTLGGVLLGTTVAVVAALGIGVAFTWRTRR